MTDFKIEYVNLDDINLPGLKEGDIDFYEVDFYPVIDVIDGKTGAVALDGTPRTFPLESLHGYNGRQLSRDEFFNLFPEIKHYFSTPEKRAA